MFILPVIYFALFLFLIIKTDWLTIIPVKKIYLLGGFSVKVITGIALGLLYTYYYNPEDADTYHYFNDAGIMYDSLFTHPWHYVKMLLGIDTDSAEIKPYFEQMNYWYSRWDDTLPNENRFIIRLNAFFMLFSFKNYWAHVVFFNVISFYAIQYFALFIQKISGVKALFPYLLMLLLPTVNIWSSGVLKEPVYFLGLALTAYYLLIVNDFDAHKPQAKKHYFLLFLGMWLLWQTKLMILAVYLAAFTMYYLAHHIRIKIYYVLGGALAIAGYFLFFTGEGQQVFEIITRKQHEFFELAYRTQAGSLLYLPSLSADQPLSFLRAIPYGLYHVFVLPLPWQGHKIVYWPYILENVFFYVSALLVVVKHKKQMPFAPVLVLFILTYGILIGITTPVLGAIVRYKAIITPMLLALFFYAVNPKKLTGKWRRLWEKI